ncbi:MAG: NAD-dependent epimerase/dehydratase family protein [Geminicoccaceae bacterium]
MSLVVITGSAGLIGSQAAHRFHELGYEVWGIDNDMRSIFFGDEASTDWMRRCLEDDLGRYRHFSADIRDADKIERVFAEGGKDIAAIIHTAAQPSHDWAAKDPMTDFTVNANGTLVLLEATRRHCPEAAFIFTSTNKVYGDTPNRLPLLETDRRYELSEEHAYYRGVPEEMDIDRSTHSLFGVSKVAADLLVQEYGRYFGINTATFRGGCLTGPGHSGAELHGFLAYLMKCTVTGKPYKVYGYKGKQVRDNIHSADLVSAFEHVAKKPRPAAVYNIGGGRTSNCSMLEAIDYCEEIAERPLDWSYSETNRIGDHMWWISDLSAFQSDYPEWRLNYDVTAILKEIHECNREKWLSEQGRA